MLAFEELNRAIGSYQSAILTNFFNVNKSSENVKVDSIDE